MPPKSLFDNSHRPDGLVMPSCKECNRGTSTPDLIAAIISRWGDESSLDDHAKLINRARKQAPDIVSEWTSTLEHIQVRGKRHLRKRGVPVPVGSQVVAIGGKSIVELNMFSHKAILALYFEHFKRPLNMGGAYCAYWKTKEDYLARGLPSELLELLPKYRSLMQGRWDESKTFEYKYDLNREAGLFGCLARLRNGLFIVGFAAADRKQLNLGDDKDWIDAGHLLGLRDSLRFQKKL